MPRGTIAKRVPQTIAEADLIVQRMRRRNVAIADARDEAKDLATTLEKVRARVKKMEEANEADQELVGAFGDAHRDELTKGGKTKSFNFPSGGRGGWGFASSDALVVLGQLPAIAWELLKEPGGEKYVSIELKKNPIKANFEELKKNPLLRRWLRLEKKERFYVRT